MEKIVAINKKQVKNVPDIKPGDTVRVHTKIIEGNKERIQIFEGVVLRVKGSGIAQTFTVRKLSYGIGVERTFLIQSPRLAKIQIVKRAKVRRAYLTYLRALRGKAAKLKDQKFDVLAVNTVEEPEEENLDTEITEIEPEGADITEEVTTEEIAKEEAKEGAEEAGDTVEELGAEDQQIETVEVAEGIEEAQNDEEHENEMDSEKREEA